MSKSPALGPVLFLIGVVLASGTASAQVLRIGGFDFNATARLQGIYSSNVQQERPDQYAPNQSRSDYYFISGLDLNSTRAIGENTTLTMNTGVAVEEHLKRHDLNNTQDPFAHVELTPVTTIGRLQLSGKLYWKKTADSQSQQAEESGTPVFVPNGLAKARDPRTEWGYGGNADWTGNKLGWGGDYHYSEINHTLAEFRLLSDHSTEYSYYAQYEVRPRFTPRFEYLYSQDEYVNNPADSKFRDDTRFEFPFKVLDKDETPDLPSLTYTFVWHRQNLDDGSPVAWKPENMVDLFDTRQLMRRLELTYFASYNDDQRTEQTQVNVSYGASLKHEISPTAYQTLSYARQPVSTLGSTLQTSTTMYGYSLTKKDLFIYNLNFSGAITYQEAIPQSLKSSPIQKTWNYSATLAYTTELSHRLSRTLSYRYSLETQNTESEPLEEHRVMLSYNYTF